MCPDGFGGHNCSAIAPSSHECMNITATVRTTETCIESPNYGVGSYDTSTKCNWYLEVSTLL